ncbi:copper resistance protein CopZ [Raineyella fluvialis]|uniref:Copper resistance protein CopZ n=2 Tax=Raineyella fluvialis TaxID=2662261 RepID=A0A5Q2FHW0_9ACTN|nr:copper resistance protein CopZ [Raineyella fluvialis]
MPSSALSLPLLGSGGGGCGCGGGGCGCGGHGEGHRAGEAGHSHVAEPTTGTTTTTTAATSRTFEVTGMTCGHCVSAVSAEVGRLEGVVDVSVQLVTAGASRVTVRSRGPVATTEVAAALEEAGGYRLAE